MTSTTKPVRSKHIWHIGKIAGVPVETDSGSILFTFFLFLFIQSAVTYAYTNWSIWLSMCVAILITFLLYASVLAHELGHTLAALRQGVVVKRVSLSPLGGVSHIPLEPDSPAKEAQIALAGPLVSFTLGLIFGFMWLLVPGNSTLQPLSFLLSTVTVINFVLAAFNLLPGLPLDGGRIVRAIIWAKTGSYDRATIFSGYIGIALGGLMMLISLWLLAIHLYYAGFMLCFTGLFITVSALMGTRYSRWQGRLRAVTMEGILRQDFTTAPADLSLGQLLTQYLLQRPFVILVQDERLVGTVSLTDSKKVPSGMWWSVSASSVMTPIQQMVQVYPDTDALEVAHLLQQHKTSHALVMAQPNTTDLKELLGVVAQHHLHAAARAPR